MKGRPMECLKAVSLIVSVFVLSIGLAPASVNAADWPRKPINFICPFDAGASADVVSRAIADFFTKELGQRVVVINKTGGGGTLGNAEVARSTPDGYTIGLAPYTTYTVGAHFMKVDFGPDSFEFLGSVAEWLYGLMASGKHDWKDIKDVVAYAKANPGKLKHGYAAPVNAMAMMLIADKENIQVNFIPTKGGSESEAFLAGGHLDTDSRHPGMLKAFPEEQIHFLHPCGEKRWDAYGRPDRPTLKEMGYDINVTSYYALATPKGVPQEIVKRLRELVEKATQEPGVKTAVDKMGMQIKWIDGDTYKKRLQSDYEINGAMFKKFSLQ